MKRCLFKLFTFTNTFHKKKDTYFAYYWTAYIDIPKGTLSGIVCQKKAYLDSKDRLSFFFQSCPWISCKLINLFLLGKKITSINIYTWYFKAISSIYIERHCRSPCAQCMFISLRSTVLLLNNLHVPVCNANLLFRSGQWENLIPHGEEALVGVLLTNIHCLNSPHGQLLLLSETKLNNKSPLF